MICISNIDDDGNILPLTPGKTYDQWVSTEGGSGMGAVPYNRTIIEKEDTRRCVDDLGRWTEYPIKYFGNKQQLREFRLNELLDKNV